MKKVFIISIFTLTLFAVEKRHEQSPSPRTSDLIRSLRRSPEIPQSLPRNFVEAIRSGNSQEVASFLSQGINLHTNHEEALRVAVENNHPHIVEQLVQAGADTSIDNYEFLIQAHIANKNQLLLALTGMPLEQTAGHYKCSKKACNKYREIFGKIFDPRETILELALLCACVDNNVTVAKEILSKGANVHARNDLPLRLATTQDLAALLQAHINDL